MTHVEVSNCYYYYNYKYYYYYMSYLSVVTIFNLLCVILSVFGSVSVMAGLVKITFRNTGKRCH